MLFMFPGTIAANDLEAALAPFFALVKEELERVSDLQISLIGFRGDARCQIRRDDGRIGQIVFETVDGADRVGPAGSRAARPGGRICERLQEEPTRGLATLLGHDD